MIMTMTMVKSLLLGFFFITPGPKLEHLPIEDYPAQAISAIGELSPNEMVTVDVATMPTLLTVYYPPLGGINCNGNCNYVGSGLSVIGCEGICAACPQGWTRIYYPAGRTIVITIEGIGEFWCVDSGGMVHPTYRDYYLYTTEGAVTGWVNIIDVYWNPEDIPWWTTTAHENWSIELRPYSELILLKGSE